MQKVSLIVTILNEAQNIELLLSSILMQTDKPEEVVIVDGGSSDETLGVIREYLQIANRGKPKKIAGGSGGDFSIKNSQITFKILTKKGNRSLGRNFAIKKAQHDLIAITDSGCILRKNWLGELKKVMMGEKNESMPDVVAGYYDADPVTPLEEAIVPYVLVMPDKVDGENFLPATRSMMMKKQVWQELGGFDENLNDNEDYVFAKKIKAHQQPVFKIKFAKKAKVTWIGRNNLRDFAWMIFRFARGDARARIIRPKVISIFARYLLFIVLFAAGFLWGVRLIIIYFGWSIWKNYKYTPRGWYYLPILQIISDFAVMAGSIRGMSQDGVK